MNQAAPGVEVAQPVELTAEQDHRRMMDLLGMKTIRPGADPRNPQAPNAVNYDEAKAGPRSALPDPLVLKSGKKVADAKTWWDRRRPEIVEDFDREIYGRVPKNVPKVEWRVASTAAEKVGGIPVTTKALVGRVDNSAFPAINVDIEMTLTTPAAATGAVPVIIEFGFRFPPGMARPPRPPGATPEGPTWQELLIAKGWGYAVLLPNTIQADNGAGLTKGIIGLVNKGQPRRLDDWGALRAWAWGASRALDYLETDPAVDAKRVGIEGLSRYGKAALVTMAYEPRFAIAFVASSGEGGAKLHRRTYGELVENVAGSGEYHWMAGNFIKYAGPLTADDLPVDAHELDRAVRAAPGVRQQRVVRGRRGLGRREGDVPRGGRRGPRLPAARQEGPGHDGVPADRDRACRRRHRVPPAPRGPHGGAQLADVHRVRVEVLRESPGGAGRPRVLSGPFPSTVAGNEAAFDFAQAREASTSISDGARASAPGEVSRRRRADGSAPATRGRPRRPPSSSAC